MNAAFFKRSNATFQCYDIISELYEPYIYINLIHKKRVSISFHNLWEQHLTYPQCFMFCGLSMRMASLILRSLSGQPLDTVILWSSDCLGLLGVGWSTTWKRQIISYTTYICVQRWYQLKWMNELSFLTFPSSLSSRASTPVLSVNSFTFTAGNGWVVVKSPWVPQLHTHKHTQIQQERRKTETLRQHCTTFLP